MLAKKLRTPIGGFPKNSKTLLSGSFISVKAIDNNLGHDRIGIVVSRRAAKKSTKRNEIKRIVLSSIQAPEDKKEAGRDILLVVDKYPSKEELIKEALFIGKKIANHKR